MIEFVTLLLGLVTGTQAIEVSVDGEVARVELFLDGRSAGSVERPPWFVNCDFGDGLAPHELVAVAYDPAGRRLDSARQWVNLPRRRAEARWILDRGTVPPTARLIWTALDSRQPSAAQVTFDGKRLEVDDLAAIELPPHDPETLHFLRADLLFPGDQRISAEMVFGDVRGEELWTELTAVPMLAGKRPPKPERTQGWFRKRGQPLRAVSVESGPIDLVVVRERSLATREGLELVYQRYLYERSTSRLPPVDVQVLGEDDRVRFAFPTSGREQVSSGQGLARPVTEQVPVSRPLRVQRNPSRRLPLEGDGVTERGSLFEILTSTFYSGLEDPVPEQELADAVAIAGLTAAAGDRRRAVLLILSGDAVDRSRLTAFEARGFLDKLRVPLFVWSLDSSRTDSLASWGPTRDVSSRRQFHKALDELRKALRSQVLVWLEGAHLPHEIALTEEAEGLRPVVDESAMDPAAKKPTPSIVVEPQSAPVAKASVELGPYHLETEVEEPRLLRMLSRVAADHHRLFSERYGVETSIEVGGRVVLFGDERELFEFKRLQGHERVEIDANGYFEPPSLVVLHRGDQSRQEVASLLLHELTHSLTWRSLAAGATGRDLPTWLEEGLAGDLALSSLDRDGLAAEPLAATNLAYGTRLGAILLEVEEKIAAGKSPSLPELLAMDRATFLSGDGQLKYLLSGLWVRYLLSGDLADGFLMFLAAVANGEAASGDKLRKHLGVEWAPLEHSFHSWLSRLRHRLPPG